jgi:hypothetical protein
MNTVDNYATIARLHIIPMLGKKRLAKLTPEDVQTLLRAKQDEGYSGRTVRLIRGVLVQALKRAERWELVAATWRPSRTARGCPDPPGTPSPSSRLTPFSARHAAIAWKCSISYFCH